MAKEHLFYVVSQVCGCQTYHYCEPVAVFTTEEVANNFVADAVRAAVKLKRGQIGTRYDRTARRCMIYSVIKFHASTKHITL